MSRFRLVVTLMASQSPATSSIELLLSSIDSITVLLLSISASALIPASPIPLLPNPSVFTCEPPASDVARAATPSSPMLFVSRTRFFSAVLLDRACASCCAPTGPIAFFEKSTATSRSLNESASTT